MKNVWGVLLGLIFLISGCEQDPVYTYSCEKQVQISNELYNSAPEKFFSSNSIKLKNNCLEVTYYFCGSDTAGNLKLIDAGISSDVYPTNRQLRFSFNAESVCLALIPHTQTFDLTPLKKFDNNHIVLNIKGWDKPIHYYY